MIPDYNHNGKIEKYDREMEEIFLEEDEQMRRDAEKQDRTAEGWALVIVIAIMVILGIKFGIH